MKKKTHLYLPALLALAATAAAAQPVLTAGLRSPFKTAVTPGGNLLVAESGTGATDGKLTMVSSYGAQFRLLGGLPSGTNPLGTSLGPTAVADAHRTVYVLIGEGDILGGVAEGGAQSPNPEGLSSPIYSSLLRAVFDPVPDAIREGFELSAAATRALSDGHDVVLENGSGERVTLSLVADFRDLEPDPRLVVRQANPFALAMDGHLTTADLKELGFKKYSIPEVEFYARLEPDTPIGRRLIERTTLYVVDAGMNTVTAVSASTGRARVLARVPPVPNPLFPGLGGPVMDPVPTGIRVDGDSVLVTLLPGFPFPPGAAQVIAIDRATGEIHPYVDGLSMATDLIEVDGALYVLELSTNFLAGAPGRIVRVDPAMSGVETIAQGLIGAAGLAYAPAQHALLVTEAFTGLVKRVPIP